MIITGQFNDALPPITDGMATVAINYAYWINKNYAPSFAIGPLVPKHRDYAENVLRFASLPLQFSGPYRLGIPWIDRNFNKKIKLIPFDLVHAHCPFASGAYARNLAITRKIPLVATFHTKYHEDFTSLIKLGMGINHLTAAITTKMVVNFYEQADAVWTPNEGVIDTIRRYGFKGHVDIIPNGSDIVAGNAEKRSALKRLGLQLLKCNQDSPILLYVGQHRWVKNLRLLIESLKVLKDRGQDFQMRLVGEGMDTAELKRLTRKFNLNNHVRFMGVVQNREHMSSFYAASDLFFFPSLYDTDGIVAREAAGLSVPTLYVRGATIARGITDGINGYLSDNNAESLASKIISIFADQQGITKCGQGAHDFLYLSWEQIAETVYHKYQEIIDRYKRDQIRKAL